MDSPDLELHLITQVNRQLLDEGEEHRLGEGARSLVEHILRCHLLTEEEHQVEVRGREGQFKGTVDVL